MAQVNRMNWQQYSGDGQQDSYYGFPSTSDYIELSGPNHSVLHIYGSGAPGSNHNNAPNGSTYIDMTNFKPYLKTGATTWTIYSSIV